MWFLTRSNDKRFLKETGFLLLLTTWNSSIPPPAYHATQNSRHSSKKDLLLSRRWHLRQPVFYAYCYPTPAEFGTQPVIPETAFYSQEMGEFFLPYQAVQESSDPEKTLTSFLESTYQAAALAGKWNPKLVSDFSEFDD